MHGILLAGGSGSRLSNLTAITNKSLLPIYNRPTIHWCIDTLVKSGINEIFLVVGGNAAGEFLRVLGNGEQFGLKQLNYAYQKEPKGIADALKYAREWASDKPIAVMLADNLFEDTFNESIGSFIASNEECRVFLKQVNRPEQYGVVEVKDKQIVSIEEKPKEPKSNLIATGLYFYKSIVWDLIDSLTPSARGELEISHLNAMFLNRSTLGYEVLNGWWGDTGENYDTYVDSFIKWSELKRNENRNFLESKLC